MNTVNRKNMQELTETDCSHVFGGAEVSNINCYLSDINENGLASIKVSTPETPKWPSQGDKY